MEWTEVAYVTQGYPNTKAWDMESHPWVFTSQDDHEISFRVDGLTDAKAQELRLRIWANLIKHGIVEVTDEDAEEIAKNLSAV